MSGIGREVDQRLAHNLLAGGDRVPLWVGEDRVHQCNGRRVRRARPLRGLGGPCIVVRALHSGGRGGGGKGAGVGDKTGQRRRARSASGGSRCSLPQQRAHPTASRPHSVTSRTRVVTFQSPHVLSIIVTASGVCSCGFGVRRLAGEPGMHGMHTTVNVDDVALQVHSNTNTNLLCFSVLATAQDNLSTRTRNARMYVSLGSDWDGACLR